MTAPDRPPINRGLYLSLGAILGWMVCGFAIAATGLAQVNDDARALVGTALIVGLASAAASMAMLARGRLGWAGASLVLSGLLTPTFAAVWLNILPILGGVVLQLTAMHGSPQSKPTAA